MKASNKNLQLTVVAQWFRRFWSGLEGRPLPPLFAKNGKFKSVWQRVSEEDLHLAIAYLMASKPQGTFRDAALAWHGL